MLDNLFELAILYFDELGKSHIAYDTPIANDVIGFLNNEDVLEKLKQMNLMRQIEHSKFYCLYN